MNPPAKLLAILSTLDIAGDNALLRLGQAVLGENGLGAELYPETPSRLRDLLPFLPEGRPATAHLPRDLDVLDRSARERILEFARAADGRLFGLTVHDQGSFELRPDDVDRALAELDRMLRAIQGSSSSPAVYLEYSGVLSAESFVALFERTHALERIRACIDIGHAGLKAAERAYTSTIGGNVFEFTPDSPELPKALAGIESAVGQALPHVLALVDRIAVLGKPLHFHLHDGHPLSRLSRYPISDHLSFLQTIRLPFEWEGRRSLSGMFGPAGLRAIVARAKRHLGGEALSFMLEIHPQDGRRPLGPHEHLFRHWKDRRNAERMAYWLDSLRDNGVLLRDAYDGAGEAVSGTDSLP